MDFKIGQILSCVIEKGAVGVFLICVSVCLSMMVNLTSYLSPSNFVFPARGGEFIESAPVLVLANDNQTHHWQKFSSTFPSISFGKGQREGASLSVSLVPSLVSDTEKLIAISFLNLYSLSNNWLQNFLIFDLFLNISKTICPNRAGPPALLMIYFLPAAFFFFIYANNIPTSSVKINKRNFLPRSFFLRFSVQKTSYLKLRFV